MRARPQCTRRCTNATMGAQVLHAIICWAVLSRVSGQQQSQLVNVNNSVIKDSTSAASGLHTKLYHNVRVASYASPYGAYSYNAPMSTSQMNIQSYPQAVLQRGPVQNSQGPVAQNQQLALHSAPQASIQTPVFKDSYGKFVQPQMAYSMNPQFVQIQALPAHLSQPLANSPIQYQYKTAAPHFFVGPQFNIPEFKPISTSSTHFASQPQVYSETVKSDAPDSTYYAYGANFPATYEPSTAAAPAPTTTTESSTTEPQVQEEVSESQTLQDKRQDQNSPTLQEQFRKQKSKVYKLLKSKYNDAKSQESNIDNQKTQTQTRITAIVNGEPTTVTLDTKPVLPLLDISLLEPLTFDTPLVTQMQHFLPKIEQATYHKLTEFELDNDDEDDHKEQQKVIVEHVYENKENKQTKPKKHELKPPKGAHIGPEISYEIKTPNGKEVYKEQVVSYNKVLKPEPQHFSYDSKAKPEPEVYSYVHNSQEPLAVTRVNYHNENDSPKHVFSSEEEVETNDERSEPQSYHHESDHSEESSAESADDRPVQGQNDLKDELRRPNYHHKLNQESHSDEEDGSEESHTHSNLREKLKNNYKQKDGFRQKQIMHKEDIKYIKQKQTLPKPSANYKIAPSPVQHNHHNIQIDSHKHSKLPKASQYHAEHNPVQRHAQKSKPTNKVNPKTQVVSVQPVTLPYFTNQPVKAFVPVIPEWAENMRLLSHSAIKVDPYQHVHYGPTTPRIIKVEHPVKGKAKPIPTSKPYILPSKHVHEKSKRIIIKEESPQELHMHTEAERIMQKMIGQEENEEDFEKAYKEAAFGFPGYESEDEIEKEVFNPESYGVPHEHLEYNIKDNPFEKYQKKGDKLPKAARLSYKDAADNTKEDYMLDYAISKPESFLDHYKHKANYFKMYKKQRPEKVFTIVPSDDKNHKPERFVAATAVAVPSYIKPKQKQFFTRHGKPVKVEFNYSKNGLQDSAAFQAIPAHYRFKSSIEPLKFASFDHIRPLIHINSELAAAASNNSPKSENPTRKKLYKEQQWYIKKTTTAGKNR